MTGLFALFYRGLLELSKSFLDPFGNRRVSISGLSADISIDCLIGESNAGSLIWPAGAAQLPFDCAAAEQHRTSAEAPPPAAPSDAAGGARSLSPGAP